MAAKDEESTIEPALRALLGQLDSGLQIIAVNDRSEDCTGAILERLSAEDPRLLTRHIQELPSGWLGKNHALATGVAAARSGPTLPEFLLFTDADVVFEPGGLRAAVAHAAEHGLDHLAGAPRVHTASWLLAGQIAAFGVLFGLFTRPWSVPNPRSSAHVGIGALNLVRLSAYERAGGHAAIAMRIDDDLRLGKAVKAAGGRSAFAFAGEIASLTWYPSLRSMLRGLHKNAFAGIDFRLSFAVAATAFLALAFVAPFVLAALPESWSGASPLTRSLALATAMLHLVGAHESARSAGLPGSSALFFPVGVVLFLGVLWRSAIGALWTGQIVWRGTSYELDELKRARKASSPY
ncbi:MAG: glycosyltransferase involved in cell wall biosynthesis [Planctomycetota bacterium]